MSFKDVILLLAWKMLCSQHSYQDKVHLAADVILIVCSLPTARRSSKEAARECANTQAVIKARFVAASAANLSMVGSIATLFLVASSKYVLQCSYTFSKAAFSSQCTRAVRAPKYALASTCSLFCPVATTHREQA
eukprot:6486138-Amphidinium_carterae.2